MPFTATVKTTVNVGGLSFAGDTATREAAGQISQQPTLPAGKAGTLTTRTDNDTGVATLGAGHGIITGDKVDVFWDGGLRYGMDATVAGNAVTVDAGAGDNLPAQATDLVVCKPVALELDVDGDQLKALGAFFGKRGHVRFLDGSAATLLSIPLAASVPYSWISDAAVANPLEGDVVGSVLMSCGDASAGGPMSLGILYDPTA